MDVSRSRHCFLLPLVAYFALCSSSSAQILSVAESRLSTYFGAQNSGSFQCQGSPLLFGVSDPPGQTWGPDAPAPPSGGAPVPGVQDVDWVSFAPSASFAATYNPGPGKATTVSNFSTAGFSSPGTSVSDVKVRFNPWSIFQESGADYCAFDQANFSVDYEVGPAGVAFGTGTCDINVDGSVVPGAASYARFLGMAQIWHDDGVGAPALLGECTIDTGVIPPGPFSISLSVPVSASGFTGSGTLRMTGFARMEGHGVQLDGGVAPIPTVPAWGLALLVALFLSIGAHVTHKRASSVTLG